ncbi:MULTISPECIES: sorbosone dehydrogenase family protein [unclassified Caulobacter]|uniref:PQQ-dependent sugar dehydrogenase n=1 Tax=unclassified Caulobacter TaxID=2648921 RepID=UPI0007837A64|nr:MULTISPECIES: sorbosone dehydrogenase family protein [unclassified Caulobacter]AZS22575.1 sorbosone dehydrogenase family protein [Caulobacter sp. FWC26]
MRRQVREILIIGVAVSALAACGQSQGQQNTTVGYGPNPTLPKPSRSLLPTVKVSEVVGWSNDAKPRAPAGFTVQPFATGLDHPRWLLVLPNGDVLVAESNKPARQDKPKGIRAFAESMLMKKAGAGVPSADRISLLRDQDGDGIADLKTPFLVNLHSPFGMALVGNTLYVANADAIVAFPYTEGATTISAGPRKIADLPGGPINHHWTKNIIASKDGAKLYAAVGSNSNVGENGMDNEVDRAAILEVDLATGQKRVFASGLRNPVGLSWNPANGQLWTSVNERDELGNDLVPDYMTSVREGGFYGWPYSYFGRNVDKRVKDKDRRPDLVERAIVPDYALGAHTASLGLTFYTGASFPARYKDGVFVGQHGSWNRNPQAGYKVIFVPFSGGKPAGGVEDFLTGFLDKDGKAQGRPVGVTVDTTGALLVADDVGNVVWRVSAGQ